VLLFDLRENIEVVIHPDDGRASMLSSSMARRSRRLSPPDMRTPIQYALTYPRRWTDQPGMDGAAVTLRFEPPVRSGFPHLPSPMRWRKSAERWGGDDAANEVAVEAFMAGKINLHAICDLVQLTIRLHRLQPGPRWTI